jgi:hypothetical protein
MVFPPPDPEDEASADVLPEEEVEQAVAVIAAITATPPRAIRDGRDTAERDGAALMTGVLLTRPGRASADQRYCRTPSR